MNTPRTDEILALLPGGQTCDPQAVADDLRPAIAEMERDLASERLKLAKWDDELSTVMPADFKDWWQNSRDEWPLVARMVIESHQQARNPAQTTGEGAE